MNPTSTDSLELTSTDPAMNSTHLTHPYLSYAPRSSIAHPCYSQFLDGLGFKPAHASERMRTAFIADVKHHVNSPSHRFLTRDAYPEAFKTVVSEFLAEYGPTYWGDSKRDHLQESDALKGFLCPRDAQREGSRLNIVVEAMFNYKAKEVIRTDAKKSIAKCTIRRIDFAAVTGRKADLVDHPSNSKKRSAAPSEAEDEEVENSELLNKFTRKESLKRQQLLPGNEGSTQQIQTLDDDTRGTYGRAASETFLPQKQASSAYLTASANTTKKSRRAHLSQLSRRGELFPDTEASSSFQASYPHGLKRPLTSTPGPNGSNANTSILLDDSDAGEEQPRNKPTTTSLRPSTEKGKGSSTKVDRGFEDVKTEPLNEDMMKKTMFLVTVHDSPIGPVPVPFTECGNFHVLFATLIEERGVADEDARKIDNITTVFTWSGGEYGGRIGGIRRNKPGDWSYFCDSLRKAHESDSDRFRGKCEVAVKLHINDKHKEHC